MTDESGTSIYYYDENNRLTGIQKGGNTQISYAYDQTGNIVKVTDLIKARYVKGINYISKADAAGKESYFLYNGHGDVVQTVDAAAQ